MSTLKKDQKTHYPEKQGLRHVNGVVKDQAFGSQKTHYPEKQGLRHINDIVYVNIVSPPEDPLSRKTRIKTISLNDVPVLPLITRRPTIQKNKD